MHMNKKEIFQLCKLASNGWLYTFDPSKTYIALTQEGKVIFGFDILSEKITRVFTNDEECYTIANEDFSNLIIYKKV